MHLYKHILVAVDLHEGCVDATLNQAISLAKEHHAKITILHAIEHINAYGVAQAYPTIIDLEEKMEKDAIVELENIRKKYKLLEASIVVEVGSPKVVILQKAEELKIDLIVVGSHGRHGLGILLGSTANAVLHHATCDVLAVRIKES